ncbi:MAG: hypothetical protein HC878_17685, partial [Leptolyngbyaceae cyanobacterium SL_5_14]|nr:hypothetical protein [Leptolyngbyaceae cyanobacterium SL_5_14]
MKRSHDLNSSSNGQSAKHMPVSSVQAGSQRRGDRSPRPVKVNVLVSAQSRKSQKKSRSPQADEPDWDEALDEALEDEAGSL